MRVTTSPFTPGPVFLDEKNWTLRDRPTSGGILWLEVGVEGARVAFQKAPDVVALSRPYEDPSECLRAVLAAFQGRHVLPFSSGARREQPASVLDEPSRVSQVPSPKPTKKRKR
jgi:hypothetical protein